MFFDASLAHAELSSSLENDKPSLYALPAIFVSPSIKLPIHIKSILEDALPTLRLSCKEKIQQNVNLHWLEEMNAQARYKALMIYPSIPRIEVLQFNKAGLIDVHIPITVNVTAQNVVTGEAVFSSSATHLASFQLTESEWLRYQKAPKSTDEFKSLDDTLRRILNETAEEAIHHLDAQLMQARLQQGNIIDTYRNLIIMDRGSGQGIQEQAMFSDAQNNLLSVVYSGLNYSVLKPLLGKPPSKAKLYQLSGNASLVQRIPALVLPTPRVSLVQRQLLEQHLAEHQLLNIQPINPSAFQANESLIALNPNLERPASINKPLPNLFILPSFSKPFRYTLKSSSSHIHKQVLSQTGCLNVLNQTGSLLYSSCKQSTLEDLISDSLKVDAFSRELSLQRNLVLELTDEFKLKFQLKETTFRVKSASEKTGILIHDPEHLLWEGSTVTSFEQVWGELANQPILIPTWNLTIVDHQDSFAVALPVSPITEQAPLPSASESVSSLQGFKRTHQHQYALSPLPMALPDSQLTLPLFESLSFQVVAPLFLGSFRLAPELWHEALSPLSVDFGYESLTLKEPTMASKPYLIRPVYRVELISKNQDIAKYRLLAGFARHYGEELLSKQALQSEVSITLPEENVEAVIQEKLSYEAYRLMQRITPEP